MTAATSQLQITVEDRTFLHHQHMYPIRIITPLDVATQFVYPLLSIQ